MIDSGDTIEAANGENHIIDNLNGEVAPWIVHVGHWRPRVRVGVVHLTTAHSRYTIETTNHIDLYRKNTAKLPSKISK